MSLRTARPGIFSESCDWCAAGNKQGQPVTKAQASTERKPGEQPVHPHPTNTFRTPLPSSPRYLPPSPAARCATYL
eukprot:13969054-Alexandrium_andersonii.AAC.1